MAIGYLALAIVLAFTLNARARWLRIAGTVVAALGLAMMVLSIILADLDGTFAALPSSAPAIHRITPTILNVQAAIATLGILFLAWSAWTQARRPLATSLPLGNDETQFGSASRAFHWVTAILMFCLVPIGLFMAILPESSPDRAGFVGAHQSLGLTVLVLLIGRIGWLIMSPPPPSLSVLTEWQRLASGAVHVGLYAMLLAFPISGYLIDQGQTIDLYGWAVSPSGWTGASNVALWAHA